ncbi:glycosyltransferase [Paraburkholderia sp. GAS82]|uniref:glycosyltransferase n=1 Tax=Paraburkholderia sp. GAS82 TaxID=3035137 RepID=UPI003D1AAA39
MRLVIDLQAAQGDSSVRGIGRYSRELALAMAREARGHEVIIALSGAFMDTAEELSAKFATILPRENIRIWYPPRDTAAVFHESARRPFAETLRAQFLASLQPDLVHVASLFDGASDDVISTSARQLMPLPLVATCYDLIPLLHHTDVFGASETPSPHTRWYYRTVQEMSLCEGLLAISESSRKEAIDYLSYPEDRIFNIRAGIGPEFHPATLSTEGRAALLQQYGLQDGFVMFLSADSPNKNEAGLLAAYARLPAALQARHQLLVAGRRDREKLYQAARRVGVPTDRLVYVPFVAEEDLRALYSICGLFVCPSRHEGFGLPLAEAMACGAPAIASNVTSLPEVIGREDATFDPDDPEAIASCMRKVLENPTFRDELAAYGPAQASRFTWQASASRAWDALETIHRQRTALGKTRIDGLLPKRSSLAYVSPLPPQASGIADYSADLLTALARHYDITLVSEDETTDVRLWAFSRLNPREFLLKAGQFDRVLYQIGNSSFHRFQMEDLLPRVSGVVVLHDAFLSDYLNWLPRANDQHDGFRAALLQSHGYSALRFDAERGRAAALQHYPCSLSVLENAVGVIQHSHHGVAVLSEHFGTEAMSNVSVIPLLRADRPRPDRKTARAILGLTDDEFVVCSFGYVTRLKCPELLADAWRQAGLAGRLVFAGDASEEVQREMTSDVRAGVVFTGRLSRDDYDSWLAAADVAVQWRTGSRGESSAAVADVLIAGLPLIVNCHGSAAELPKDVVVGLPDDADSSDLAATLAALILDPVRRTVLGAAGRAYAKRELAPRAIAQAYFDKIERAYAAPSAAVIARSMQSEMEAVASLPDGLGISARAIARSFPSPWRGGGHPRLLIDISEMARVDLGTGIQRVVREIIRRTLETPPQGRQGEAVRALGGRFRHTYAAPLAILGHEPLNLPERPLDVRPGDVLLCADVNPSITPAEFDELRRLRLDGLRVVLLVYDLLPLRYPELFPADVAKLVAEWYGRMLSIADAAVCISQVVADDVSTWLSEEPGRRDRPLPIGAVHLGADFPGRSLDDGISSETLVAIESAQKRPTVIMVGTVEPRKGHSQALAAFERLWADGEDIGLIIVGNQGWNMEAFARQLQRSPELGKRLHWLRGCGDAGLRALYGASSGLVMASRHEGFGLPIAEALHAGVPVLARDLPVFREMVGDRIRYFSGDDPQDLAVAIRNWVTDGFVPRADFPASLTWDSSYRQLCDVIFGNRWYKTWLPEGQQPAASADT